MNRLFLLIGALQQNSRGQFGFQHSEAEVKPNCIGLKGAHGKFVSIGDNGSVTAPVTVMSTWEEFTMEDLPDGLVALKSWKSKYIRQDNDGSKLSLTNESFGLAITWNADGTLSLKSNCSTGFWTVRDDGSMDAWENLNQEWQRFTPYNCAVDKAPATPKQMPSQCIALKSPIHNRFVTAGAEGAYLLAASAKNQSDWEEFKVSQINNTDMIKMKTYHGKWVKDTKGKLDNPDGGLITGVRIYLNAGGTVSVKTSRFWTAVAPNVTDDPSALKATRSIVNSWERFNILPCRAATSPTTTDAAS